MLLRRVVDSCTFLLEPNLLENSEKTRDVRCALALQDLQKAQRPGLLFFSYHVFLNSLKDESL